MQLQCVPDHLIPSVQKSLKSVVGIIAFIFKLNFCKLSRHGVRTEPKGLHW